MFRFLRRKWITRRPFPEAWKQILQERAPVYADLPAPLKEKLHRRIQVFLGEKYFEGCAGLVITEEKRVLIAAYACLLILAEPSGYYPALKAILVYPDRYMARVDEEDAGGIVTEGWEGRSGESWNPGNIVLSWNDFEEDLRHAKGRNLVCHEFAHQMDYRYGLSAGVDPEGGSEPEDEWAATLAAAYDNLRRKANKGLPDVLDHYGATHPAECFAVSVESFMGTPGELKQAYPRLYGHLVSLFGFDPARFISSR